MLFIAFFVSLIPSTLIFLFLRNRILDDQSYKSMCQKALLYGLLSIFPVMLASFLFSLIERFVLANFVDEIPLVFYHTYIVLAFSEELVKYMTLHRLLKKSPQPYTYLSIISCMTLVGLGFGVMEDIPYALSTNAGQMIVRGVTAMHAGYGFIMGCLIVKHMKRTGKRHSILALLIPVILHGTYDCFLSDKLMAVTDLAAIPPVTLALFAVIVLVYMIFFFRKARNDPEYTAFVS